MSQSQSQIVEVDAQLNTVSFSLTKIQKELCLQTFLPQIILQSSECPKSLRVAHVLGKSQIMNHQHFYLPREN